MRRLSGRAVSAALVAMLLGCGSPQPSGQPRPVVAEHRPGLAFDRYAASAAPGAPVVVLVHGCCGDRRDLAGLGRALARAGAIVVNADVHAVGRGGGWPATYLDVVCAYSSARAHGGMADPAADVTVLGWGDGAMVATAVALGWADIAPMAGDCRAPVPTTGPRLVIGVSGHYGWTGAPGPVVNAATIEWFGGTPDTRPTGWSLGNPGWWLDQDERAAVSFALLATAGDDASATFATELRARSVPVAESVFDAGEHGELIQPRGTLGAGALGVIAGALGLETRT